MGAVICKKNYFQFLVPPIPESTTDYEEIHEYEVLKQNKDSKLYQNNEVVDKICISLKPEVMETIRDHMRSNVSVLFTGHAPLTRKIMCLIFLSLMDTLRVWKRNVYP